MKRTPWQIQKAVVFALTLRELKTRFGNRLIGLFWVLFEPMANISIMLALKVLLRERFVGIQIDVAVFLVVAMIPFFNFRNIWFRMMQAVDANSGLFGYRQVKPADAMAARAMIETVMYTMIWIAFMLVFAWIGFRWLPLYPLEYIGIVLVFLLFGVGLGLWSAVQVKRFPALAWFVQLCFFPLYITSGVLIPLHAFSPQVIKILLWNPMLHLVELSRWAFFPTYVPLVGVNLTYPMVWTLSVLFIGVASFFVNRNRLMVRE